MPEATSGGNYAITVYHILVAKGRGAKNSMTHNYGNGIIGLLTCMDKFLKSSVASSCVSTHQW